MLLLDFMKSLHWSFHLWKEYNRDWLVEIGNAGKNCKIGPGIKISHPKKVTLGSNVVINSGTIIHSKGGVSIGDNSIISYNCTIWTSNHRYMDALKLPYDDVTVDKKISIGANVWMGFGCMVVPGVTVGEGAVIGMGSVIVKDVPPMAVMGGCPATKIKERDFEHYSRICAVMTKKYP